MTAPVARTTRATLYFSTIGGVTIAWDICGACCRHVRTCTCDDGPVEPEFLVASRTPEDPPARPMGAPPLSRPA